MNTADIIIKQANPEHAPQLAELEQICFSDPWSESSLHYALSDSLCLWLMAVDDSGTIFGYAGSQLIIDEASIMNVAVAPQARQQGIGTMVLTELLHALAKRGAESVTLEVRRTNTPAKALYSTLGFVQVGCRPNYYDNPREDALILGRSLREETI